MAFTLFQKKAESPLPPHPPQLSTPTSRKSSFSKFKLPRTPKTPKQSTLSHSALTPTLLVPSIQGEKKRTAVLESQLRDLSLTATQAYDEIEDLKLRNSMLQDQVIQQKSIIEALTKELDQASKDKITLKEFGDQEMKKKLDERINDKLIMKKMEEQIIQLEATNKRNHENSSRKTESENVSQTIGTPLPDESTLTSLQGRIKELEWEIRDKSDQYQSSLNSMQNTLLVIRNTKSFLYDGKSPESNYTENVKSIIEKEHSEDEGGDTFIVPAMSLLRNN